VDSERSIVPANELRSMEAQEVKA